MRIFYLILSLAGLVGAYYMYTSEGITSWSTIYFIAVALYGLIKGFGKKKQYAPAY